MSSYENEAEKVLQKIQLEITKARKKKLKLDYMKALDEISSKIGFYKYNKLKDKYAK